jgi:hypothetical protein
MALCSFWVNYLPRPPKIYSFFEWMVGKIAMRLARMAVRYAILTTLSVWFARRAAQY